MRFSKRNGCNAPKAILPKESQPQLATLATHPPISSDWLHEIKYDGYRLMCHINKSIKLMTRGQKDWTDKFQPLIQDIKLLNIQNTILDGEIVALDKNKLSNFQQLQNNLHDRNTQHLVYYVFDILYYNGYDLRDLPLIERKKILKSIFPNKNKLSIQYSDHIIGDGEKVFKKACQLSYEGIISKKIDSPYLQKRTKNWLKIKCMHRQEFIVCGVTKPKGKRSGFGSLILGYYDHNKNLHYAGLVGTGFNRDSLKEITTLLKNSHFHKSPFPPSINISNLSSWVKPTLVVEVEFKEWTKEGVLRHPSFKGVRSDKSASKVTREKADNASKAIKNATISITNPEKLLYPEAGITKASLAEYFQDISPRMLPYIINRPLSILRCPDGVNENCFYQKHLHKNNDLKALYSIQIKEKSKTENYIYIKDLKGLLQLIQMGVLEIHPWGCHVDNIEKPDSIIFDLDPGPDVEWKNVVKCAFVVKKELEALNLRSFVKTTGGKGLHIVVPIQRRYTWSDIINFSKVFVQYLSKKYPTKYIDNMSKAKRIGKIYIDYLRNHRGSTIVAPYSTRASSKAPISVPLSWDELSTRVKSDQYNVKNISKYLNKTDNPWTDYHKIKQTLPSLK